MVSRLPVRKGVPLLGAVKMSVTGISAGTWHAMRLRIDAMPGGRHPQQRTLFQRRDIRRGAEAHRLRCCFRLNSSRRTEAPFRLVAPWRREVKFRASPRSIKVAMTFPFCEDALDARARILGRRIHQLKEIEEDRDLFRDFGRITVVNVRFAKFFFILSPLHNKFGIPI